MKKLALILLKLTAGYFLIASSTVMALNSNLGLSPWDVFHQGLSNVTGMTIGQASIVVGVIVIIITRLLRLEFGFGTILNMIVIGCFIDLIISTGVIPVCTTIFAGILMLIGSLFVLAFGCFLYIGCEMGCGPRDGLMIVLTKITGWKVGIIRLSIESSALIIGWILGGKVGIGTFVIALGAGYCIQLVFKLFRLDVGALQQKNFRQTIAFLKALIHDGHRLKSGANNCDIGQTEIIQTGNTLMQLRSATISDINDITNILKQAQDYFKEAGIKQWQDGYPNAETINNDIADKNSYVLIKDDIIVATAAISFDGEKAYNDIYEGEWVSHNDYAVMHRIAVDSTYKGSGFASLMIKYAEQLCQNKGVNSIRIDTHEKNISMHNLLFKNNFQNCGVIYLADKSRRMAFEKTL